MAIIGVGEAAPSGIETQTIADEALVAAVSQDDQLVAKTTVTLQALKDQPLIRARPLYSLALAHPFFLAMASSAPDSRTQSALPAGQVVSAVARSRSAGPFRLDNLKGTKV